MWENADFVFDTSAICKLYDLTDHYRGVMIDILMQLQKRLWIPNQVKQEYLRNRKKAIRNPIVESYKAPLLLKYKFVKDVNELIKIWENNKYSHPFLDKAELQLVKDEIKLAEKHITIVKNTIRSQYENRKNEINCITKDDKLLDFVNNIRTGSPLSFSQIKEIMLDGDFRYRNQLPPGYEDKEKTGVDKYGDLIIWKGLIGYAKDEKKDIIYISEDVKADWANQDKDGYELRSELIAEFQEGTDHKIMSYTLIQFIDELKKHFQPQELPLFEELECVANELQKIAMQKVREHSSKGEKIIIKCDSCGKIFECWSDDLDFEWDGGTCEERSMDNEINWHANGCITCPHCDENINIEADVYEYPVGAFNYGEINCDNGMIINKPDLESICPLEDFYKDKGGCCRCGEFSELNEDGLCDYCQGELDRIINSDD